jgi:hypothetical protein
LVPLCATPATAAAALKFLEDAHLIGALDLDQALTEAARLLKAGKNPYLPAALNGEPWQGPRKLTPFQSLIALLARPRRFAKVSLFLLAFVRRTGVNR